jgi:hypothetical protein
MMRAHRMPGGAQAADGRTTHRPWAPKATPVEMP